MEIKIEQPIDLHLEVIETDDQILSMCVHVKIVASQFQHECRYEGTFWIECTNWEGFTNSLRGSSWQEAVLRDISGYFMLTLRRTEEEMLFVWEFAKADVGGDRQVNIVFSSKIDDDIFGKIRREFLNFPVWW